MMNHMDTIKLLCEQCDYKITMSCHLKRHAGIHSDGKHIAVNQCDYETPISADLTLHEIRIHSDCKHIDVTKVNMKYLQVII